MVKTRCCGCVGVGEEERWSWVGRCCETTPPCPYVGTCVVVVVGVGLGCGGVGGMELGGWVVEGVVVVVGVRLGCSCVLW
jgi:hypothetical protein